MSQIISFLQAHSAAFGMLGVAVIDFAIKMNPNLESDGVLHMVYLGFQSLIGKGNPPPAAPAAS